jgi:hypothetical protein
MTGEIREERRAEEKTQQASSQEKAHCLQERRPGCSCVPYSPTVSRAQHKAVRLNVLVHICNPSYSGGRGKRISSSRPALGRISQTKTKITKTKM